MNTFDSIIGYEKEKKELRRISDMLINEEKYKKLGVTIPGALLIYGDPGLGKTLMAKALAKSSRRERLRKEVASPFGFCNQPE